MTLTPKQLAEAARITGRQGGLARAAKLTAAERKRIAIRAAARRWPARGARAEEEIHDQPRASQAEAPRTATRQASDEDFE